MNGAILNKRFSFLFLLVLVFALYGCKKDQTAGTGVQMPPAAVKVYKVESQNTPYFDSYIAQAEGSNAVEVRAQVSGILRTQDYIAGQFINAGDLMFTIEPDTYQAAVVQAQGALAQTNAQFVEAKENYDRIRNLYAQSAVSKKDYDSALAVFDTTKATVESAKAALRETQIRLGYTYVTAPVSGYTSKANFSQGNLISASATSPLTFVNTVDPIYVNFAIPASTLNAWRNLAAQGRMKIDNYTVELTLEDGSVYGEIGNVIFLDKRIDPFTGEVQVRAEFKNPNTVVLPGQYVKAKLLGNTLINALIIPQKSVLQLKDGSFVISVDDKGMASYRKVDLGMNIGNDFLVNSGIESGEVIIIEGVNKVRNGAMVRPVTDAPAGNPTGKPAANQTPAK